MPKMLGPNLLARIRLVSARALESGALKPIATESVLTPSPWPFTIRVATNLARKAAASATAPSPASSKPNPFLPYDEELFVADAGPEHVVLLNKFNVVPDHILVVTRAYAEQGALLSPSDFAAMHASLTAIDGLAFYNSGPAAGASQRHKHMQVVPYTALGAFSDALSASASGVNATALPFLHAFAPHTPTDSTAIYTDLLASLVRRLDFDAASPPFAYNLLMTGAWILVVPRRCEGFDTGGGEMSVNSLAFAGSLFVRDGAQADAVKYRPMDILQSVTFPR